MIFLTIIKLLNFPKIAFLLQMRGESDEYGIHWRRDEYEKSQASSLRRFLGGSPSSSTPQHAYHHHENFGKKEKDEKKEKRKVGAGAKQHNNHAHVVSYNYSSSASASSPSSSSTAIPSRSHREEEQLFLKSQSYQRSYPTEVRSLKKNNRRKMGKCANTLRSLVFFFNFLFWITGIVILGLGIWIFFDPAVSDYYAVHSSHPGSFRTVGWLLVAAGSIMTLIGCFGCCGAYKLNQCALLAFFFILVLVFLLELAAAVIAYNKQENIRSYVESSMFDTIRNRYSSDENYRVAFDTIQTEFQCCGVRSYSDWLSASWDGKSTVALEEDEEDLEGSRIEHGIGAVGGALRTGYGRVPASCCNEDGLSTHSANCGTSFDRAPLNTYAQLLHSQGCADALFNKISNNLDIIIAVCVIVGALQLLGMIISMALCCCVNNDDKKYNS